MTRFGTTDDIICAPINYGLSQINLDVSVEMVFQSPHQNSIDLLSGKLDIALISPNDYAKDSSRYNIYNDIAISTLGAARSALLFFRQNLSVFTAAAFREEESEGQKLAAIVMNEFYEASLDWQPQANLDPLENAIEKHQAVLAEGEQALSAFWKLENHIDMHEEWSDKADAAFIHRLLVRRADDERDFREVITRLQTSRDLGLKNPMQVARQFAENKSIPWNYFLEMIEDLYSYHPRQEDWDGMQAYFEYLYYYGFIEYIPGMNFAK